MPQPEPDIVKMNGANQNRNDIGGICSQHISVYLVTHQSDAPCMGIQRNGFADAAGERFCCMCHTANSMTGTKIRRTLSLCVGHNTKTDPCLLHGLKPGFHRRRRVIPCIGHNGIIKIQQQDIDAVLVQNFRRKIGDGIIY